MKRGILALALFFGGIGALGGVNAFFSYTNEMEFCVSCHTMQSNYEEYQNTIHYKNKSGVQATCADCHVPKEFFPKLYAKVVAVKDVYHQMVGTIDTAEKFEARRYHMASIVWSKMQATDSRECRGCHSFDTMDLDRQDKVARSRHIRATERGQTCIECHQGIAHKQPEIPEDEIEL